MSLYFQTRCFLFICFTFGCLPVFCQQVHAERSKWNSSQVCFIQDASLDQPTCKSRFQKQNFKFHWKIENVDLPSTPVLCFFFPLHPTLNVSNPVKRRIPHGVLNATATSVNVKKRVWSCDLWLPEGVWVPILGYQTNNSLVNESHTNRSCLWMFSTMNLDNRVVRSWIHDVSPKLLMADSTTSIDIQANFLESIGSCQIIPRIGTRFSPTQANLTNSSLASCPIYGHEGVATLRITWDQRCSVDFEIEFLLKPITWSVEPSLLPTFGEAELAFYMHSGQKDLENSITMFLPQKVDDPAVSLQCGEGKESHHKANFTILADHIWRTNVSILNTSHSLDPGVCNISVTLNGRDYFDTNQSVQVGGPEVGFLSKTVPIVNDGVIEIAVVLNHAISLPASISMHFNFSRYKNFPQHRFELLTPTLTWHPGEKGPKAFQIRVRRGFRRMKFFAELAQPQNCSIMSTDQRVQLITVEKKNLPVFRIATQKVLYPGEQDSFTVDVILTQGKSTFNSLLEYEIRTKQLNQKCAGNEDLDFLMESFGQIKWKHNEKILPLPIHVNWENITFCDELEVTVVLKGIKMATVEKTKNIVARIYGTPERLCPPGTVTIHGSKSAPFPPRNKLANVSLSEIKIEGRHVKNDRYYDAELVPPFTATHHNYTAMIPHDMKDIQMKLIDQQGHEKILIEDDNCLMDQKLHWKARLNTIVESKASLRPDLKNCTLQVKTQEEIDEDLEDALEEEEEEGSDEIVPRPESSRVISTFRIHFLHLSDPNLVKLRSVEIRNSTHLVSFCGPKAEEDSSYLTQLEQNDKYKLIGGSPRTHCLVNKPHYMHKVLLGDAFVVIPRLEQPEILGTKVEVSGIFLRGFEAAQNNQSSESSVENETILLAAAFDGISLRNASFGFDIRVTAEDTVTSNLYRFIYGNPQSAFQLYPSGSSFDMATTESSQTQNLTKSQRKESRNWPVSPSKYKWCSACAAGSFSVGVNTLECALCPPGHFTSSVGNAQCLPCQEGTFSYTWGSKVCRPCMTGTAANKKGSEYCQLCPEGYITDGEGAAHCTVSIKSTDLHSSYVIVASFGVVLNGTSLEEVERLGTGVHASGIMILKTLIRTDMADALNISVGDVTVKKVESYGDRALLIDVDTTFKVNVDKGAEPEEVDAKVKKALLKGDDAVKRISSDPDKALKRTTKATHSHARMSSKGAKVVARKPVDDSTEVSWQTHIFFAMISCCILFISCTVLAVQQVRKKRRLLKPIYEGINFSKEIGDLPVMLAPQTHPHGAAASHLRYRPMQHV